MVASLTLGVISLMFLIGAFSTFVFNEKMTIWHIVVFGLLAWFGWTMAEKHRIWYREFEKIISGKKDY